MWVTYDSLCAIIQHSHTILWQYEFIVWQSQTIERQSHNKHTHTVNGMTILAWRVFPPATNTKRKSDHRWKCCNRKPKLLPILLLNENSFLMVIALGCDQGLISTCVNRPYTLHMKSFFHNKILFQKLKKVLGKLISVYIKCLFICWNLRADEENHRKKQLAGCLEKCFAHVILADFTWITGGRCFIIPAINVREHKASRCT